MKLPMKAAVALLVVCPIGVSAEESKETIDEIIVAGHSVTTRALDINVEQELLVDTAAALKNLPGANVNSNGPITGIAQYRGMFGDRVAITIDNHAIVSGGPNAMDAPISYVSPMITESLQVERGIASVTSAAESIGGHIRTSMARGEFAASDFELSGFLGSRYSQNGDVGTSAGRLTLSNQSHRISAISEVDSGSDIETPAGTIRPSGVDRKRYDLSYAYAAGDNHLVVFAGRLDTVDSGTPALPMDILFIETDLAGGHFQYALSPALTIEGRLSVNDVDHLMDNFSYRQAPMPMMYRQNRATGSGETLTLAGTVDLESSSLKVGLDGVFAEHDSIITNPNNAAFRVINFSDVQRDLISAFGEWTLEGQSSDIELGLRFKRVSSDAGDVGVSGMMNAGPQNLATMFNAATRDLDFDDIDAVVKYSYRTSSELEWQFELGQKSRAPSYQELYLWLPLQATGGLADGRTYIGDLTLDSEKAHEVNIGLFASIGRFNLAPQIYFKRIDGFIQGVPATNAMANMVSTMMTGQPALQFANTDADIWGVDVAWTFDISERLKLDGIANYSRGRRTDVSDNLYRLAPFNGSLGLVYNADTWSLNTRFVAYASQKDVSAFNAEQQTEAYEIFNLGFSWSPASSVQLEAHVENLFDTTYQDHLAGINRAMGSDIAVGTRLYGAERTLKVGISYHF